jgi:hypothetical protein
MTEFRNITRIQVDFINRDGVPTALVVNEPDPAAYASIDTEDDGLSADIRVYTNQSLPPGYTFVGLEDADGVPHVATLVAPKSKSELGPVGRWSIGVVALAILAPFVAILWAWAGQVFRSFS